VFTGRQASSCVSVEALRVAYSASDDDDDDDSGGGGGGDLPVHVQLGAQLTSHRCGDDDDDDV